MCGSEDNVTIKLRAVGVGGMMWLGLKWEETKCAECDNGEVEDVKHKVMVQRERRVNEEKERRLLVAAG